MSISFFLSLKNLGRKRNSFAHFSTILSMIGVSMGVAAIIIVMGVMSGFDKELQKRILSFKPHIYITSFGKFNYPSKWERKIEFPEIKSIYPVIWSEGIIKTLGEIHQSKGIIMKGIEWKNLPSLGVKVKYKGKGIIAGKGLLKRLGVREGEKVFLLTPELKGEILPVSGIFETGMYQFDSSLIILPIGKAQKLLDMRGEVSGIEIKLYNPMKVDEVKREIRKILPPGYEILTWKETEKTFFKALHMEKITMFTILILILLVASLGITSSLILKVTEKRKDVGILRALGFTPREIGKVFLYQGIIIGFIGGIIGEGIAYLVEYLIKYHNLISLPSEVYSISYLPCKIEPLMFIYMMLFSLFLSFISTILPAYRASHIEVSQVLRYE